MSFSQFNLDPAINKAIHYDKPTPVQAQCIPAILNGKDLVASAQTGTGKTAAFVLPALQLLSVRKGKHVNPRVLILSPTRELAAQITQAVSNYGKFLRLNMANLVGGMSYKQQLRDLSRAVDVIVATPGRLLDHMERKRVNLSEVEILILDEADRMLDMGFIDDVQMIAKKTPATRQTLLFSATIDKKLATVVRHLLKDPVRIDLSPEKMSPALIKQSIYMADSFQHKEKLFQHYLENENIFKAIIFSGTKINADKLANKLRDDGYNAEALHGDLNQNKRNRTVEQLRRGKIQFVVATDVAARGIDISDMTHVINYDLPRFCEDYVHRIGRTGRAGKTGIAISFVLPMEMRHLQRIERFTGQSLRREIIPGLEPKKNFSNNQSHAGDAKKGFKKKKHFGDRFENKSSGFKKKKHFDGDRKDFKNKDFKKDKFEGRGRDFAKKDRFDDNRKDFKKSDRFEGGRKDFKKKDGFESRGRDFKKTDRFEGARRDFKKKDSFVESRGRSFKKKDGVERDVSIFHKKAHAEDSGKRFSKKRFKSESFKKKPRER